MLDKFLKYFGLQIIDKEEDGLSEVTGINLPGSLNPQNGYHYIEYEEFCMFIDEHDFPDEFYPIFDKVVDNAMVYIEAHLDPYVMWNGVSGNIFVTSREKLEGKFIQ